jgi:hypothetical protein
MRKTIALASFAALTAGAVGVGAVDNLPAMVGSDTLKQVTIDVIATCNNTVHAQIVYAGTGSGAGQNALLGGSQGIAPMSRALNNGICGNANRTASEGLVIGLDGVDVVGDAGKVCTGITHTGAPGVVTNDWRSTLRMIYAGMGPSGSDILTRDCNQQARKDLLNNWDAIFQQDCSGSTCQTDSHPSFAGTNPNVYDANNAIVEPGLRHAFRRDEESGTTDVFLGLLSLPTISFGQARPTAANSLACSATTTNQDTAFRVLSNSIFCNAHRPTDTYPPTFIPANVATGEVASFVPEIQDLGFSPCTGGNNVCPEDGGTATHLPGWDHDANPATPPRWVVPNPARYFPEMQDQDPVRRKCVGTNLQSQNVGGVPTPVVLPTEQVCGPDGQLGVVLAINPPPLPTQDAYPTSACQAGKSDFGPAVTTATGSGIRCPNGDKAVGAPAECRLPQASDNSFNCLARGGLWTAGGFTGLGGPGTLDDVSLTIPTKPTGCANDISVGAPTGTPTGTRPRSNVDGRVYNQVLRAKGVKGTGFGLALAGTPLLIHRPTNLTTAADVPLIGSFYRIHSNRSLLNGTTAGTTPADKTCQKGDATRQIGCLVQANPCSLGYAGGEASDENPGTLNVQVNSVTPGLATIQNLVTGGFPVYPLSRKLYVNSLRGFDNPLLAPVTAAPIAPNDQMCIPVGSGACTVAVPSVAPTTCDLQSGTASPQCCCDDSEAPTLGPDRESELVSCFQAALPGTILANRGFFPIPGNVELCEDFNEAAVCTGVTTNTDACVGNVLIPAGSCSNLLKDGAETDVDCGGVTCGKCAAGLACVLGTDCTSGTCSGTPKVCQP